MRLLPCSIRPYKIVFFHQCLFFRSPIAKSFTTFANNDEQELANFK